MNYREKIKKVEKVGYGHWKVTVCDSKGMLVSGITINSMRVDAFQDNEYGTDLDTNEILVERLYKEIIAKNNAVISP
jgi:hypothetical protein